MTWQELPQLAPRLKHPAFSAEKEWRIVAHASAAEMQFREVGSSIAPYIEIPMARDHVVEVRVGPSSQPDISHLAASELLVKFGVLETPTRLSKTSVPYRASSLIRP
jgi:hypothetical protein